MSFHFIFTCLCPSKTPLPPRLHHMFTHHQNPQASPGAVLNTKNTTTGFGQLWATGCWSVLGSLITCLPCSFIFFLGMGYWPLLLLKSERYSLVLVGFTHYWFCGYWFLGQQESLDVEWACNCSTPCCCGWWTAGSSARSWVWGFFGLNHFSSRFKSLRPRNSSVVAGAPDSTWLT